MAEDIASIDIVVPSIFGFFATNPNSAVPIVAKIGIIRPRFARKKEDDVDIQKIISEITANPNMSIQEIIMKNPKIIEKIMKNI